MARGMIDKFSVWSAPRKCLDHKGQEREEGGQKKTRHVCERIQRSYKAHDIFKINIGTRLNLREAQKFNATKKKTLE